MNLSRLALSQLKIKEFEMSFDVKKYINKSAESAQESKYKVAADDFHTSKSEERGESPLARLIYCLAHVEKGASLSEITKHAERSGDYYVSKSLNSLESQSGGFLIPPDYRRELIGLLRPFSAVRTAGAKEIFLPSGTAQIPQVISGVQGSYEGELGADETESMKIGMLEINAKKLVVKIPISEDLLWQSPFDVESLIMQEIIEAFGTTEDRKFLRSLGDQATPKGLLGWALESNKIIRPKAGSVATLAEIDSALRSAKLKLMEKDVKLMNAAWIMNPRTHEGLMGVRDGNGNLVYAASLERGMLKGQKVIVTNNIPTNLATATQVGDPTHTADAAAGNVFSEIYFADFASIYIGEADPRMQIMNLGRPVSGPSNYIMMRGVAKHNLACKYNGREVAVIRNVDWGNGL
jgi:HK97 family phage major capsid protein